MVLLKLLPFNLSISYRTTYATYPYPTEPFKLWRLTMEREREREKESTVDRSEGLGVKPL